MTRNEDMLVSNIENFVDDVVKKYPGVTFETSVVEDSYGYDVLLISLNSNGKTIRYDIQVNLYDPETYGNSDKLVSFDSTLRKYIKNEIDDILK
jgi:hypothetical protein|nr:MAG TPA: hypothetical protein [Bacteriophage sp.]